MPLTSLLLLNHSHIWLKAYAFFTCLVIHFCATCVADLAPCCAVAGYTTLADQLNAAAVMVRQSNSHGHQSTTFSALLDQTPAAFIDHLLATIQHELGLPLFHPNYFQSAQDQ